MNLRQTAAKKAHSPDQGYGTLEHQAENAARLAGKSVEEWLQDVINEQTTALNAAANHGAAEQDDADYSAKSAVLNELVDRVRHLENSFEANQQPQFAEANTDSLSSALDSAARTLNNNYDEDARALIEGIRARAQSQNQLPPNPPQAAPAQPQGMPFAQNPAFNPHDANADRMMEMLGTLGYLEQQLKANLQQVNPQPAVMMQAAPQQQVYAQPAVAAVGMPMPAPQVAPAPAPAAPAAPVEDQEGAMRLSRLEDQLARIEKHLTTPEEPKSSDEPEQDEDQVYRPKRNRRTKRSTKSGGSGEAPILSKSSHKMGKKQGNQALRQAMGAIVDQHADGDMERDDASANVADAAQTARQNVGRRETDQHFQALMTKIEALSAGATDRDVIENLKGELSALKGEVTAANAQTSFAGQNIHDEVKRLRTIIATMQESSIDSALGSRLETLETDVNRIAEFLLKSPDLSAVPEDTSKLQSELNRLSDGLLAVIDRTEQTTSRNGGLVVSQLQENLSELRNDIMSNMQQLNIPSNVAGAVSSSLEDRFNTLQTDFNDSLSALNGEVAGLGSGLKDQVSIISAQVHSATERLEALGDARNGDAVAVEKFAQMEGRLVKAAERLEAASMDAASAQGETPASLLQLPVDLVTEQGLRSELSEFATSLGLTLESGQSSMVKRIDDALAKLDMFADQQDKMIEDVARRSAEKTVQQMGTVNIAASDDPADTSLMMSDLTQIRQMADQLIQNNSSSFMSVHGLLDGVAGRLASLEQQGNVTPEGDNASSAALAAELQDLRNYLSGMKTSADDLSAETRSSFHSVKDMLSRVSDRLTVLEASGAAAAPLVASVATFENEDVDAFDDEQTLDEDVKVPEEPAVRASSAPTEEEVMQRMRDHVKAREPDAPILVPADDDVPIEPGSGRPVIQVEAEPDLDNTQKQLAHDEIAPQFEDEHEDDDFDRDVEDQTSDSKTGSRSDFIQAARRAAQAAAAEQALQLDDEPKKGKSSLSAIRDRINKVARGGRKSVVEDHNDDHDQENVTVLELDKKSAIEPDMTDPVLDGMNEKPSEFSDDLADHLAEEKPKSGPLRTALMASVFVAILSISGYLLKEPINKLITGKFASTASQQLPPPVVTKPAVVKKAVPQEAAKSEVSPTANSGEATTPPEAVIDLNASSLPPSLDDADAVSDIIDGTEIVDPSTTQSITRQLDFNEASPQSGAIRDAMKLLPKDKVSEKLSDALLEGDPTALLEVGRRFGEGAIFERDLKKSAFWYEQAAAQGSAIAKFRLGTLYEDGVGVPKNPIEAKRWYIEAADEGNARAMHNLAVLHAEGALGRPDFEGAFQWFEKGANHGVKDSQFNVGILYVRGLGVQASLIQAYKWFDVVAKVGDLDAAEKRNEIAKALPADQLKDAKAASAAYKPIPIKVDANVISPSPDFWLKGSKLAFGKTPNGLNKSTPKRKGSPQVREAQLLLNRLGFKTGVPDGLVGKRTRDAVRAFEYEIGMPQTGRVNKNLIQLLKSQSI